MRWLVLVLFIFFSCTPKIGIERITRAYPIKSIDPDDVNFDDLSVLGRLLGDKRIVVLGMDAHENATGIQAHHRMIKYLTNELGFTRVLFEKDLYPMWKAYACSVQGTDPHLIATELGRWLNYYPVEWTSLFEDLLKDPSVLIGGFDFIYDGLFSDRFLKEITLILEQMKVPLSAEDAAYYLQFVSHLVKIWDYKAGSVSVGRIDRISQEIISDLQLRETDRWPDIYTQIIRNNVGVLKWANTTNRKNVEDLRLFHKGRDIQMANNILWWLKTNPEEKIIISCSDYHAARNLRLSNNVRPMIDILTDSIPDSDLYVLANITYGGQFGYVSGGKGLLKVPSRTRRSIEAILHERGFPFLFLHFDALKANKNLEFVMDSGAPLIPRKRRWAEVYDGFFFIDNAHHFTPLPIDHEVNRVKILELDCH